MGNGHTERHTDGQGVTQTDRQTDRHGGGWLPRGRPAPGRREGAGAGVGVRAGGPHLALPHGAQQEAPLAVGQRRLPHGGAAVGS